MMTLVVSIIVLLMSGVSAGAYTFKVIDPPFAAASDVTVTGLNDAGVMVGTYHQFDVAYHHGFFDPSVNGQSRRRGEVYPLLNLTPQGVNNSAVVVGWYITRGTVCCALTRGFLYHAGTLWLFEGPYKRSWPGGPILAQPSRTQPTAMNDAGVVVGSYSYALPDEPDRGFVYDTVGQTITTIEVPGAHVTGPAAINTHGRVIGHTMLADGTWHLFTWFQGELAFFTLPGLSSEEVNLAGITDAGIIAGSSGATGFVWDGLGLQVIEVPDAVMTTVTGIRNDGTVYGSFDDAQGKRRGFIATPDGRRIARR